MDERMIIVDAPTPGFTSILITACDETSCAERVLDLEVRALAELFIEEIRVDDSIPAGEIFEVRVFVRNSGQVTATLVSVRCTADGQSFGTGVIQMLTPGQLGSVTCDMQAPENDDSLLIEAEVDRGTSIDEVNETNNLKSTVVAIVDPLVDDTSSSEDSGYQFSQMTVYIITGGVLLLILTVFGMLAPAKIRKLE
jgi:subtilase family serine protease